MGGERFLGNPHRHRLVQPELLVPQDGAQVPDALVQPLQVRVVHGNRRPAPERGGLRQDLQVGAVVGQDVPRARQRRHGARQDEAVHQLHGRHHEEGGLVQRHHLAHHLSEAPRRRALHQRVVLAELQQQRAHPVDVPDQLAAQQLVRAVVRRPGKIAQPPAQQQVQRVQEAGLQRGGGAAEVGVERLQRVAEEEGELAVGGVHVGEEPEEDGELALLRGEEVRGQRERGVGCDGSGVRVEMERRGGG